MTTTPATPRRLAPDTRKADLLTVALHIARTEGLLAVTRNRVAEVAEVSPGLVTFRFLSVGLMREAVMTEAVRIGDAVIVAGGIALRDPQALAAPLSLRQAAADAMIPTEATEGV